MVCAYPESVKDPRWTMEATWITWMVSEEQVEASQHQTLEMTSQCGTAPGKLTLKVWMDLDAVAVGFFHIFDIWM